MNKPAENLTDEQILTFRSELLADSFARTTDAPYACLRALKPARGKNQKAARATARAVVWAAMATWVESGKDGATATIAVISARGAGR